MADKYCSACERLKDENLEFYENGISDKECKSLQNDTGLNPDLKVLHNDCEDLNDMNDCMIGQLADRIAAEDDCEWKPFITRLMGNLWNMYKGIICAICGIWEKIHLIIDILKDNDGYVTVIKTYEYTVPVEKFVKVNFIDNWYWSGSPELGECFISIPVKEMDLVDTIVAQPQVSGGHVNPVTVAVQSAIKKGDIYEVNFDTYEAGNPNDYAPPYKFPYSVTIEFVVVGRKKVKGL